MAEIDVQRTQAEALPEPGRRNWLLLLAAAVTLAALAFFGWRWWEGRNYASTDDAQVGGDVVPVLARVSGYVQRVAVEENEQVKEGQLLVVIDDSELKQQLAQAEAALQAARNAAGQQGRTGQAASQAQAAQASAAAARSSIAQAEANAEKARSDVERLRPLAEQQIVSRQQFEAAQASARAAEAQLQAARQNAQAATAQAAAVQGNVSNAQSQLASAEAAVAQARLQLGYSRIPAPMSGVVARKNVQPGQMVSPGQPLMSVVPLSDVWVTANLKETQLRGVGPGDPAEVKVDAYPGLVFHGHVESVSPATGARFSILPPDNATGNYTKVVQRVPVRIKLDGDNPDVPLRPGMSTEVSIRKE